MATSNTKDIESNAPTSTAAPARSTRSLVCLSLAAAAALLVFFVAGTSTGAAIVIVSRDHESASQAEAREAFEIQAIMMGLNSTALKNVEIEWEALKASHPDLVVPMMDEMGGRTSRGNGTHGRRAASIYDTATPGLNHYSVGIPRDNSYTLLVKSKLDVLDQWCPILETLEAANNQYAIWWAEANLGIIPGHYSLFCLLVPHVKLMYTVYYKYGMYRHVGNVVPGGTETRVQDLLDSSEFRYGVTTITGSSSTRTQGSTIGADLRAELEAGLSASGERSYTVGSQEVQVRSQEWAERRTRELTYVNGYHCVDSSNNDLSNLNAQPHYQFQYVIRYADGREVAINTQQDMHMCLTCGDERRYSDAQSPYKDDDRNTCPPRRLAPDTFLQQQREDSFLCYKTEAQLPSQACAYQRLNWQTWDRSWAHP